MMEDKERMRKVSFTMPERLVDELDTYAEAVGMTRAAYLNMASVIGMRAIARQFMPEAFLTPELIEKMQSAGLGLPEQVNGEAMG